MVEISNNDDLRAWLADQPAEVAAILAGRAALRATPVLAGSIELSESNLGPATILATMRAVLNSLLIGTWEASQSNEFFLAADHARLASLRFIRGSYANFPLSAVELQAVDAAVGAARTAAYVAANSPQRHGWREADLAAVDSVGHAAETGLQAWELVRADVAKLSDGMTLNHLRQSRLLGYDVPQKAVAAPNTLVAALAKTYGFEFWLRWYNSVVDGKSQNWEMLQQIVLIDDDIWKAGPGAVAWRIGQIEARFASEPIPKTILREQVTVLLQNATIAQTSGNSLAHQIEDAITSYLRDEECNGLSEDLSVLEHLPATLRCVTTAVSAANDDKDRVAELELAIQAMASEIQALKDQLETLQTASPDSPFLKSFKEQSGKSLGDWKMWGALISGSYLLLGEPTAGTTLGHIADSLKSLIGPPP